MFDIQTHGGQFVGSVSTAILNEAKSSKVILLPESSSSKFITYNSLLKRIVVYATLNTSHLFYIYDYDLNLIMTINASQIGLSSAITNYGLTCMILDDDGKMYVSSSSSGVGYTSCVDIITPGHVWTNSSYGIQNRGQLKVFDTFILSGTTGVSKINKSDGKLISYFPYSYINSCNMTQEGNYIFGIRPSGSPSFNVASGVDFKLIKTWLLGDSSYTPIDIFSGDNFFGGLFQRTAEAYVRLYNLNDYTEYTQLRIPVSTSCAEQVIRDVTTMPTMGGYTVSYNKETDFSVSSATPLKVTSTFITVKNQYVYVMPISKNSMITHQFGTYEIQLIKTR